MSFSRRSALPYVGLGSGFGGWFGVALALIWDVNLPLGLVIGASLGVGIGLAIDAVNGRRDRREQRCTPPQQ
jgi:hypothetical protein